MDFLFWLHTKGVVKGCHELSTWKDNYMDDELHDTLIKTFYNEIKGVPYQQLQKLSMMFIKDYKNWNDLTEGYNIIDPSNTIIISGSPDFLIKAFCNAYKIKHGFGSYLYLDNNNVSGIRLRTYDAHSKSALIESLMDNEIIERENYIIGLGDTKHDKGIFDYTNDAYLICPSDETLVWYENNCKYYKDIKIIK